MQAGWKGRQRSHFSTALCIIVVYVGDATQKGKNYCGLMGRVSGNAFSMLCFVRYFPFPTRNNCNAGKMHAALINSWVVILCIQKQEQHRVRIRIPRPTTAEPIKVPFLLWSHERTIRKHSSFEPHKTTSNYLLLKTTQAGLD